MADLDEWLIGVLQDEQAAASAAEDPERLAAAESEERAAREDMPRLGLVGTGEPRYCDYCQQWTQWPCESIRGIAALYSDRASYDPAWRPRG